MLAELEKKVAGFVEAMGLFSPAGKVLLSVSGGADSIALLHILRSLRTNGVLDAELLCVHINHQLRANEADLDEQYTVEHAKKLGLPIITKRIEVRKYARECKMSIETAARQLRIESLIEIAEAHSCMWIATGHQKNDNAETVIQRLTRGTGFRGLAGIWPMQLFEGRYVFARPLLCITRREITDYLTEHNIEWREDKTNTDCSYRRNSIRHRLIPVLQRECTDSVVEQLSVLAQSAYRLNRQVQELAERVWAKDVRQIEDTVTIDARALGAQAELVKVELVRRGLVAVGCGERDITQKHYLKILQLASSGTGGKKLVLPGACEVRARAGKLVLSKSRPIPSRSTNIEQGILVQVPGLTRFGQLQIEATIVNVEEADLAKLRAERRGNNPTETGKFTEHFDLDKIRLPLQVRFRKAGDRFQPLGMVGEKKVGKFLTATRVPYELRDKILIVSDREKIIWIYPVRMSEQAKLNGQTSRILKMNIDFC